jgi:hydroxyacylglutathione hydrolase
VQRFFTARAGNGDYGTTLHEGAVFRIGRLELSALHTPGHTDESMSYVLIDRSTGTEPIMVFTGDALFVSDVGRTDLYGPDEAPRLAGLLYESIFEKLLPLMVPARSAAGTSASELKAR